ncbi:hypothetical protein BH09BAC5_BH09BAC5_15130 [soil metagenome]
MRTGLFTLLFVFFCYANVYGQEQNSPSHKDKRSARPAASDSITPCFSLGFSYAFQIPGGDLAQRFGSNSSSGIALNYKTKNNWTYGVQWTYLFGKQLRGADPLDSIETVDGFIIDKEGKYADIREFERGFTLGLSAGKVFNCFLSPNKNSGFMLSGGIGFMQHKIKIYDNGARSPQLNKQTLKGYDRLTSGIMTTEFAGYYYLSRNRYVNFFAGLEFNQGFTKSQRSWDYSLMAADTQQRIDLLSGVRVGWILPLYKTPSRVKYYY